MKELTTLQQLKVYQLAIEEHLFNGSEPNQEYNFLMAFFNNDEDEVNDLLVWRKEDKTYFKAKLTDLLKLIENSKEVQ